MNKVYVKMKLLRVFGRIALMGCGLSETLVLWEDDFYTKK